LSNAADSEIKQEVLRMQCIPMLISSISNVSVLRRVSLAGGSSLFNKSVRTWGNLCSNDAFFYRRVFSMSQYLYSNTVIYNYMPLVCHNTYYML